MGLWTAWYLRRLGRNVLLLDPWGAGNSRSSSGGETRILRATYGTDTTYVAWARQAIDGWKQLEQESGKKLFLAIGTLWIAGEDDSYERAALVELARQQIPHERLEPEELARRFPQMGVSGIRWAIYEPEGGILFARQACQALADAFVGTGGQLVSQAASPDAASYGRLARMRLADGSEANAETFVFACGPWLPQIFPDLLRNLIRVTKQDVFFLGTPAGDPRFAPPHLPAWVDMSANRFYGVPALDGRGLKIAPWGEASFEPTDGERIVSPESLALTRDYLTRRFPALADAPVVETRVCQFEMTPDEHFIIDRHPDWKNVWILGGGSGHSFKHGPALGAYAAGHIAGLVREPVDPHFRLERFGKKENAK